MSQTRASSVETGGNNGELRVIFILGAGNSGTTLLGNILHEIAGICSIGELSRLLKEAATDKSCACGRSIEKCELWSMLLESNKKEFSRYGVRPPLSSVGLFLSKTRLVKRDALFWERVSWYESIYEQIRDVVGCKTIIDGSKDPLKLFYLSHSKKINLKPVILVRDPLGYINSDRTRKNRNILWSYVRWIRMNMWARRAISASSKWSDTEVVSFSELISSPKDVSARIGQLAESDYDGDVGSVAISVDHQIGGTNSSRRNAPLDREVLVEKKGSKLLVYFVYKALGGSSLLNRFICKKRGEA